MKRHIPTYEKNLFLFGLPSVDEYQKTTGDTVDLYVKACAHLVVEIKYLCFEDVGREDVLMFDVLI